jgi:hypothetical protein
MVKLLLCKLFLNAIKKGCETMANRRKGEHEAAMVTAKHLLDKHVGMGEIIVRTQLTIEEINKARAKM